MLNKVIKILNLTYCFVFISTLIFSHIAISKENLENKLTPCEISTIDQNDLVTKALIENWVQPHKYKNEFMIAWFRIILDRDGRIIKYYLTDVFCGIDKDNECKNFVANMKETIKATFPIAKWKLGVNGDESTYTFKSDYGNAILEDRKK